MNIGRAPQDAMTAFLEEHNGQLVALAYMLTGNLDSAREAVQDASLKLLGRRSREVANVKAYARRAVINECTSFGRRRELGARRARQLEAEWVRLHSTEPDPYLRIEVMAALQQLTRRERTAVTLKYFIDLPDAEIAEVLQCAEGTVRSLMSRAMVKLRRSLKNGESDG